MRIRSAVRYALAFSSIAQVLARRIPIRGSKRVVFSSYRLTDKAIRPDPTVAVSSFGDLFNVDFNSSLEWQIWAFGTYEAVVAELFSSVLCPGQVAIDVGANIGVHTVRLAKLLGPSGKVIAIEPSRSELKRLQANISLNSLNNVEVVGCAASRRTAEVEVLYEPQPDDPNRGRASLVRHPYLTGRPEHVSTVAIDDLCLDSLDLIKMDVEGAEIDVLVGASRSIQRYRPIVLFEYSPALVKPGQSAIDFFRELAYRLQVLRVKQSVFTGRSRLYLEALGETEQIPQGAVNILASPGEAASSSWAT